MMNVYKEQFNANDIEVFRTVRALQSGNDTDTNKLYELTNQFIRKLINDIVNDPSATDEVCSDAYMKICNGLNSLDDPCNFYAWAGRIATTLSLEHIRKNRIVILDEEKEGFPANTEEDDNEEFIPESVLTDYEKMQILEDRIEALSVEQKICIQFFYYEKMSVGEIAEAFDCSEDSVRTTLNCARKELKETILSMDIKDDTKLYSLAGVPLFYILFRIALDNMIAAGTAGASAAGGIAGASVSGSAAEGSAAASSVSGQAVAATKISSEAITAIVGVGTGLAVTVGSLIIGINVAKPNDIITYDLTREEYEAFESLFSDVENMYTTYPFYGTSLSEITEFSDAGEWISEYIDEDNPFGVGNIYEGMYDGYYISYDDYDNGGGIVIFRDPENSQQNYLEDMHWVCSYWNNDENELSLSIDGFGSSSEEEWYPFMEYENVQDYLNSIADIEWNEAFLRNHYQIDLGDGRKVTILSEDLTHDPDSSQISFYYYNDNGDEMIRIHLYFSDMHSISVVKTLNSADAM